MTLVQDEIFCSPFSFDELFELDCPVTITGLSSFSIDCTSTGGDDFCTYTERVQGTGTLVGSTWTVTAKITVSNEVPTGCSNDSACSDAIVVVERISDPPTACTFAGANSVEATIVGGPLAGSTAFETFGSGSGSSGIFAWIFSGTAGTGFSIQQPTISSSNIANLNVNLAEIDLNTLPVTIAVSVVGGGAATSALANGTVSYIDQTTAGGYFFSSGGSGVIRVNEVSDTHIAGTIVSLMIDGLEYAPEGGEPMSATRSLTGGFHVREDTLPSTKATTTRTDWLGRIQAR